MLISKFLSKNKQSDTIIKSIIFNTIIETFKQQKNINIEKYLISIKILWNIILVKTTKPLINSELILLNEKIINKLQKKFKRLDLKKTFNEIKYK